MTLTKPTCGKTFAEHWVTWQKWDDDCDHCGFRMVDAPRRLAAWADERRERLAPSAVEILLGGDLPPAITEEDDDLTERLAGVVADMLSRFRGDGPNSRHSGWVPDQTLAAWRAVYREWADRVAPEGRPDVAEETR